MTRAAVATVLTARPWEELFVSFVRETAALRVVTRAYDPEEAVQRQPAVILAGSETPWVSPALVQAWRRRGIRVIGLYPPGDQPGKRMFEAAGADATFSDDVPAIRLARTAQALSLTAPPIGGGRLLAVTGPRGAPGRTEISLAIAWAAGRLGRTLLVDLDPPSLGIRLGLRPRPGLRDALDAVRSEGDLPANHIRTVGPVSVLTGVNGGPLTPALRSELVRSALGAFDVVVADLEPWPCGDAIVRSANTAVLVCDASPIGMVRAASMVRSWTGPTPLVIVNRADDRDAAIRNARRALGLEPVCLIPTLESVSGAIRNGAEPPSDLVEYTAPVQRSIEHAE